MEHNCSSRASGIWKRNLVVWVLVSLAVLAATAGPVYADKEVQRLMVGRGQKFSKAVSKSCSL